MGSKVGLTMQGLIGGWGHCRPGMKSLFLFTFSYYLFFQVIIEK